MLDMYGSSTDDNEICLLAGMTAVQYVNVCSWSSARSFLWLSAAWVYFSLSRSFGRDALFLCNVLFRVSSSRSILTSPHIPKFTRSVLINCLQRPLNQFSETVTARSFGRDRGNRDETPLTCFVGSSRQEWDTDAHGPAAYQFACSTVCRQLVAYPPHTHGNPLDLMSTFDPSILRVRSGSPVSTFKCRRNSLVKRKCTVYGVFVCVFWKGQCLVETDTLILVDPSTDSVVFVLANKGNLSGQAKVWCHKECVLWEGLYLIARSD